MPQRIAAALSFVAFAVCIAIGAGAGNPFGTVVLRALLAMLVTLVIGLVLGAMAQRMLDENLKIEEGKNKNVTVTSPEDGR
jgi:uncharacterized membrane protein YfcA